MFAEFKTIWFHDCDEHDMIKAKNSPFYSSCTALAMATLKPWCTCREGQELRMWALGGLSREAHTGRRGDYVSDKPGRIWGPGEVVDARWASVLRQDRHGTGCGEEGLRIHADSTGFVPQDVNHSLHSDAFCREKGEEGSKLLTKIH